MNQEERKKAYDLLLSSENGGEDLFWSFDMTFSMLKDWFNEVESPRLKNLFKLDDYVVTLAGIRPKSEDRTKMIYNFRPFHDSDRDERFRVDTIYYRNELLKKFIQNWTTADSIDHWYEDSDSVLTVWSAPEFTFRKLRLEGGILTKEGKEIRIIIYVILSGHVGVRPYTDLTTVTYPMRMCWKRFLFTRALRGMEDGRWGVRAILVITFKKLLLAKNSVFEGNTAK